MTQGPPRIGISAYRERSRWGVWEATADLLPSSYADSVLDAGGLPLLLPGNSVQLVGAVEAALNGVDGLILSGGPDVDPCLYGQQPAAQTDEPRVERDAWETQLALAAMRHGMPVLGICRGLQIINVAMGGTLAQHLPDVTRSDVHRRAPGQFIDHPVRTAPGSRISEIVGPQLDAPSHHHQGVDVLASGLVATAWAEDGVVEAAEALGAGWVVAVQWHPEEGHSSALFRAFVAEAAANRDRGAVTTAAADAVAL